MSAKTVRPISEPFFTTKEVGTPGGIVQPREGRIETPNTPGQGSTLHLSQTVSAEAGVFAAPSIVPPSQPGTSHVVLMVEDDDNVRLLARCVLESAGYRVLEAIDGAQAMAAWREFPGSIDLLLSDMVLPGGLSGTDVAARFHADRPESRVLFSSGYNVERFLGDQRLRGGFHYLAKPYLAHQLVTAVADAIAGAAPADSAAA